MVGDDRERAVADHGFSAQHIITLAEKPEQELHQPQIVSQLLVEFGFLELMFLYLHSLSRAPETIVRPEFVSDSRSWPNNSMENIFDEEVKFLVSAWRPLHQILHGQTVPTVDSSSK